MLDQHNCDARRGLFRGAGVGCLPAGAYNSCCIANFDGRDGVNIDDIFQFLGDWFQGNASCDADLNGSLTVDDIFLFLQVWFGGCA